MRAAVVLRLAARAVLVHRLRSALSAIGVVCGVAAVVAMSAVGEGARREAIAQVGSLGIDSISLRARPDAPGPGLDEAMVPALRAVVPRVVAAAPLREADLTAQSGDRRFNATAVGTTEEYAAAARLRVDRGRFLAPLDVQQRTRVAVLGATVAGQLFPMGSATGQWVRLGGDWFEVVGVLEGRGRLRNPGPIRTRDVNRCVFVPLASLDRGRDPRRGGIDEVVLRVADADGVMSAAEAARAVGVRRAGAQAFEMVVPREILRQKERTQRIFDVVTGAVAALSLLVGGIGIMNVMLASVAERSAEVGIRRALGASERDIASQFLAESSLLTAAGGALGLLLGAMGASAIDHLAGWPTAMSLGIVVLALLVAVLTGLGFGLYPALRAAKLSPVEALRGPLV